MNPSVRKYLVQRQRHVDLDVDKTIANVFIEIVSGITDRIIDSTENILSMIE